VTKGEINIRLRNPSIVSALGDDKLTYGVVQRFQISLQHCFDIVAFPGNGNTHTVLSSRKKVEKNKVIQKDIDE
jgi:hypothetical protein